MNHQVERGQFTAGIAILQLATTTQGNVHCDTATSYYKCWSLTTLHYTTLHYTTLDTTGSNTSVQTHYKQDSLTTGANRNTAPLWALHRGPAKANLACSRSGLVSQHTNPSQTNTWTAKPPPLTVGCLGRTNEARTGKTGSLLRHYRGEFWIQLKQERERVGSKEAWNCICAISFFSAKQS